MPMPPRSSQEILTYLRDYVQRYQPMEGVEYPTSGLEIATFIRMLFHIIKDLEETHVDDMELSGPRVNLLFRLLWEEERGNFQGLTPSELSHNQHVTRNTISALLNGLEEQGLIVRELDKDDRRLFRIRLTDKARLTLQRIIPERVTFIRELVAGLTVEEQKQLVALMAKLFDSIYQRRCLQRETAPDDSSESSVLKEEEPR